MSQSIFCIATSQTQAETIVERLKVAGFGGDVVSVLFPGQDGTVGVVDEQHGKGPEGVTVGVGAGGLLGGAFGWIIGIGALAIPGVGPLVAAGPILAALSGAAVGAAIGGITGALVGMGIPEDEAKRYEGRIKGGGILISVHTDQAGELERARRVFEESGAEDIASSGETDAAQESLEREGQRRV